MMKYIINKTGPILFPVEFDHQTFAPAMGEIQSSGYCVFWFGVESKKFECFTLPDENATSIDYAIIEKFLNG